MAHYLQGTDLTLLNPRWAARLIDDHVSQAVQVTWEGRALAVASALVCWFGPEMTPPMAWYQLGRLTVGRRPLFIGSDPRYAHRAELVQILRVDRAEVGLRDTLAALAQDVVRWARSPSFAAAKT